MLKHEIRNIDDTMIPELCEWVVMLEGKVKRIELV